MEKQLDLIINPKRFCTFTTFVSSNITLYKIMSSFKKIVTKLIDIIEFELKEIKNLKYYNIFD